MDWADEKAREWLGKEGVKLSGYSCVLEDNLWIEADERTETSLAALLREVEQAGHGQHGRNQGKSTHGPCCTCGRCHQFYDDCRCDLDDAVEEAEQKRASVLAEVRRVVEDVYERDDDMPPHKRDEILSRLESL